MNFPNSIRELREKCLLSQDAFARELGVSFSTINRWEKGKTRPTYKTRQSIDAFCKKHNIDYDISEELK